MAQIVKKMPHQSGDPAPVYKQLTDVLEQLVRTDEVKNFRSG
jgi:hypothetical protein